MTRGPLIPAQKLTDEDRREIATIGSKRVAVAVAAMASGSESHAVAFVREWAKVHSERIGHHTLIQVREYWRYNHRKQSP